MEVGVDRVDLSEAQGLIDPPVKSHTTLTLIRQSPAVLRRPPTLTTHPPPPAKAAYSHSQVSTPETCVGDGIPAVANASGQRHEGTGRQPGLVWTQCQRLPRPTESPSRWGWCQIYTPHNAGAGGSPWATDENLACRKTLTWSRTTKMS